MRPTLCEEALRLGRILAQLTPAEPEVHGLLALMEIQASRIRTRTGPSREPVLLLDRGLAALARAEELRRRTRALCPASRHGPADVGRAGPRGGGTGRTRPGRGGDG